jgi:hypothetical protein
VVLVDEAAEPVAAADLTRCCSCFVPGFGRLEFECTVRPVGGVCAGIDRHGEGEEELYMEGVAIQGGPESCVGVCEGAGEALTGYA